jgi:hypothetical protein
VDVAAARLVEVVARAPAASAIEVAIGTPMPSTARVVFACRDRPRRGCRPPGAHEVQRAHVGGAAADEHRHVEVGDEPLEVQRLGARRDVLGRDDRALDDEQVDAAVEHGLGELHGPLRGERGGDGDAGVADLLDPGGDEVALDRLGVDLLHAAVAVSSGRCAISSSSGSGSSYAVQSPRG